MASSQISLLFHSSPSLSTVYTKPPFFYNSGDMVRGMVGRDESIFFKTIFEFKESHAKMLYKLKMPIVMWQMKTYGNSNQTNIWEMKTLDTSLSSF